MYKKKSLSDSVASGRASTTDRADHPEGEEATPDTPAADPHRGQFVCFFFVEDPLTLLLNIFTLQNCNSYETKKCQV